jgi:hypothetical protein
MILLNTILSDDEKQIIEKYISEYGTEVKLFCTVDEKRLFHSGANQTLIAIKDTNRMIDVGGLVLLEEKSDIGNWNMGDFSEENGYVFWGEYGGLDSALRGL